MFRSVLLILLIPALAVGQEDTGQQDPGAAAYAAGDYEKARQIWEQDARTGDPEAQYRLGNLYETGTGVDVDYETAAKWYEEAIKADCRAAQCRMGELYMWGRTSRPHPLKAIELWGNCVSGGGVCRDDMDSLREYAESRLNFYAGSGRPEAQMELAYLAFGKAEFQVMASWFGKAAANGHGPAQVAYGDCYLNGYGVDPDAEKGESLVLQAMIDHPDDPDVLQDAITTLAFSHHNGALADARGPVQQYVWAELALRYYPDLDTDFGKILQAVGDDARNRLPSEEYFKAKANLELWQGLISSGLPDVTQEHLRTLCAPGASC